MTKPATEIRGFRAGTFHADDETAQIKICRSDDSVNVELVDYEADIVYKFEIPFDACDGDIAEFSFIALTDQRKEEQEL